MVWCWIGIDGRVKEKVRVRLCFPYVGLNKKGYLDFQPQRYYFAMLGG